jgi:magnesium-transporting ATPase (P-type)
LNFGQPDFDYWYLLVSTVPPIFLLLLLMMMMMMPTKTLGQTWWMRLTPETMAFSGCSITSGVGKGLVVDTGMSTRTLFAQSVLHTGAAED